MTPHGHSLRLIVSTLISIRSTNHQIYHENLDYSEYN